MLPEPSGKSRYSRFSPDCDQASYDFTCVLSLVSWLVLWLCWCFNDVVFRISWLNNEFWLAAIPFEFVLAVSGLWAFQQACFLYSNKVVAGKLACNKDEGSLDSSSLKVFQNKSLFGCFCMLCFCSQKDEIKNKFSVLNLFVFYIISWIATKTWIWTNSGYQLPSIFSKDEGVKLSKG